MVTSHFLTSSLKNVRIYAPTTSNLTLQDFVNELNHLNKILQDFGNFILTKRKFILKVQQSLTETEIYILIKCL